MDHKKVNGALQQCRIQALYSKSRVATLKGLILRKCILGSNMLLSKLSVASGEIHISVCQISIKDV